MLGAFGVKESTTTTGTGNLTIASVSGYPRISDVGFTHSNARRFPYSIVDSDHKPIERGWGYLTTDANTLVRESVKTTYTGGTYDDISPTAVSLASGTKYVLITPGPAVMVGGNCGVDGLQKGAINGYLTGGDTNVTIIAANTFGIFPFMLRFEIECTGMKMNCSISHASDTNRFGLATILDNGRPGRILIDTGAISCSSTGIKTYTLGTSIRLYPGNYYLLCNGTGANPQWTGYSINQHGNPLGADSGNGVRPLSRAYIGSVTDAAFVDNQTGTIVAQNPSVNCPNVVLTAA